LRRDTAQNPFLLLLLNTYEKVLRVLEGFFSSSTLQKRVMITTTVSSWRYFYQCLYKRYSLSVMKFLFFKTPKSGQVHACLISYLPLLFQHIWGSDASGRGEKVGLERRDEIIVFHDGERASRRERQILREAMRSKIGLRPLQVCPHRDRCPH
jgi:hypothetical protein